MVLNLHGEVPSDPTTNTHVLNAEATFLPHLVALHKRFPRLRIVLEHATSRAALECVKSLGDTVYCTITVHHLALVIDDWAGQSWNYCKPVAKTPDGREALREIIREGQSLILYIVHGFTSIPNRPPQILFRFRLRSPSISFQIHVDASSRMCCRYIHFPHTLTAGRTYVGIIRGGRATRGFYQQLWQKILPT